MAKLGGLSPASGRLFPEIGGFDAKGKKEKKKKWERLTDGYRRRS